MIDKKHIFLGHASEDKPRVRELYHQLKAEGFSPWLDVEDLIPGQNWRIAIPKAIKSAAIFLACLSKHSISKQGYVMREFRTALSAYAERPPETIYLIPVRLDDCKVPDFRLPEPELNLRDLHWVDLFAENGFEHLVSAIQAILDDRSDEDEIGARILEALRKKYIQASTLHQMKAVWYQLQDYLDKFPKSIDARLLNDKVEKALVFMKRGGSDLRFQVRSNQMFAVFKDIDEPRCPAMVLLPPGSFLMGSPEGEAERLDYEGPQHEVTISRPFALGRYAVTFEEYDHFCDVTGHEKPHDAGWGRDRHPVINVSYNDALAYCAWLSEETGRRYYLPTEAMWEYACRAGTTTPFSFGANITTDQVNYHGNYPYSGSAKSANRRQTVLVGSLPANPWGLHEMHGNVREWCADWGSDYSPGPVTDPEGPATGTYRVLRGGAWRDDAGDARSACRDGHGPSQCLAYVGFRCAAVLEES